MVVTFQDAYASLIARSPAALERYAAWRATRPPAVIDFVQQFEHDWLFDISSEEIRHVIGACEENDNTFPLGNVQPREQLREVEDLDTPFALQHLFHMYLRRRAV